MEAASGQVNAQPWTQEEMAARQEESLEQKLNQFTPRFVHKFNEDTQGIPNLKQPPWVTFVSKEGKKFWVPRRLLLARCPGLKCILLEKGEDYCGPVELKKFCSKTVEVLIQYLEEGTLHVQWRSMEVIGELCEAAKEYELPLLFEFLEESLVNLCTSFTAFIPRQLAVKLGMDKAVQEIDTWLEADLANAQRAISNALRYRNWLQAKLGIEEAVIDQPEELL